ncbi:MAG: ABC transporter substrate-binding protein [Caulobacteraceae bacterium]
MRAQALALLVVALAAAPGASAGVKVFSLDQCADQYVLALSPRAEIVGLSERATNADSFLRAKAAGLPRRRADLESILAARPSVVVRYWGGDPRLSTTLARWGVRTVTIADAHDFSGVALDIRKVAAALGQSARGEALIARMDGELAQSRGAWRGEGALYLTSTGFTAGRNTLIDAMMRSAGLSNLASGRVGYGFVPLETLVRSPPAAFVEGFFDETVNGLEHWSEMRNPLIARMAARRTIVSLPGSILACPAWFAADGTAKIANQARRR